VRAPHRHLLALAQRAAAAAQMRGGTMVPSLRDDGLSFEENIAISGELVHR